MHVFSASQVSTYLLCPRKWAWEKIAGIKASPGPSLVLGTAVHAELEGWLRDAKPLNLLTEAGKIAMAGLHHLPTPGSPGLAVEQAFSLELGGLPFRGLKDFQILDRQPPLVGDHKTTKDFRWAKSAEDLREDVQACLYAADAMLRTGHDVCDLQWTYFRTTGARASQVVHLRVTVDDIAPTVERTVQAAKEMTLMLRARVRAEEVPINATACEAYGGCPYQSNCNLTTQERFKAIMTQQTTSSFLQQLQGRINPPEGAAAPPPTPPPGQPWFDSAAGVWRVPEGAPIQQAAPPPPVFDPTTGVWRLADGTPIPPPSQQAAPPPPPAPPAEQQPAARRPGRPRKAPEAPAAPQAQGYTQQPQMVNQAIPPDQQAEAGDLHAKVATLLRQASAMVLTAAAIVEEL